MRRDSIFYRLFQQFPQLIFELLPEPPSQAAGYQFDSVEVKETSFRIDGVFLPPDASGTAFFVEVQFQPDDRLYERMVAEAALYLYRSPERCTDWQLVAIYPTANIEQENVAPHQYLIQTGKLVRIYLDELGDIAALPLGIGLMLLTTLEGNAAKVAARGLADRARNQRAIINMISTILVYKFSDLTRDEVARMLTTDAELKGTRIYRDIFSEGEQQGLTKGAQQANANLVLKQLHRRFGELSEAVTEQVSAMAVEQLEALGEALLDWQRVEELTAWLEQQD